MPLRWVEWLKERLPVKEKKIVVFCSMQIREQQNDSKMNERVQWGPVEFSFPWYRL